VLVPHTEFEAKVASRFPSIGHIGFVVSETEVSYRVRGCFRVLLKVPSSASAKVSPVDLELLLLKTTVPL